MKLQHFAHLDSSTRKQIFFSEPKPINPNMGRRLFCYALGGTLYLPGNRKDLKNDITRAREGGVTSVVLDLEDSVRELDRRRALSNIKEVLMQLDDDFTNHHLDIAIFVRLPREDSFNAVMTSLVKEIHCLAGVILPKFQPEDINHVSLLVALRKQNNEHLWVMPVLETGQFISAESRVSALVDVREALLPLADHVLAIRVGTTDLSGMLGLRRTVDFSVHDVHIIANSLADILSVLGHGDGAFDVIGPVWEHFVRTDRVLKPLLRTTPFAGDRRHQETRRRLMSDAYDGLIREILLDRANGLIGKTTIHPDQAKIVNAMSVVSFHDWKDAQAILGEVDGGVDVSASGDRMNEIKPHTQWAHRVLLRSRAFGVSNPDVTFADILAAEVEW